ncbi:MAG: NAD-dependent epimerase/dehydratase family protein [candidate division Zixibacteria bacterium]|nr:NAD-dependent epimerase/dehydratase family protein [candidate division Zixibacteria bacterium]
MHYFITGGAGFIGSHLVDRLMSRGEVTVYDNLTSGKIEFISHHLGNPAFKFIQKDLLDYEDLKEAITGHDMVFHLAANPDARLGIEKTRLDLEQETMATFNVLEAMRENSIKKIVFSSSGTIYGETPVIPLPENYGPVLPISLYGAGKVASEALISAFCHTFDIRSWIFRFSNIIGPRGTHGVIYDFIHKLKTNPEELEILGDGTQEKPYLSVEDCVGGILFGLENSFDKVNFFNLGCESTTTVKTIARIVVKELKLENVKFKYTGGDRGWPGDVPKVRFDIQKMKNLGWRPELHSDEAVLKATKSLIGEILGEKVCKW